MHERLIRNARLVNEGRIREGHLLIQDGRIRQIIPAGESPGPPPASDTIDAGGRLVLPGAIDDQVHFREPGLTHKAEIFTESRAAVAGGITSYMEMPNTRPQTVTLDALEAKNAMAAERSLANYSFYLGATNDNLNEIRRLRPEQACGLKVFMGSSTGNMLVDDPAALEGIFSESPVLVATHCEDEVIIRNQMAGYRAEYGEAVPFAAHPDIRNAEACYLSSAKAVDLADRCGTRLHVLHISTGRELGLFRNDIPADEKQISAEVCVHHLWFHDGDYADKGSLIKWNPAVKSMEDREALRGGLVSGKLDVVATDHAPHTLPEKQENYFRSPSGGPLVQHALPAMFSLSGQGVIGLTMLVEKMCHTPARIFQIQDRGFIREGYFADLVIMDEIPWKVNKHNILYKCGWSPFEGMTFSHRVAMTLVNGRPVYRWDPDGQKHVFPDETPGMRLAFSR